MLAFSEEITVAEYLRDAGMFYALKELSAFFPHLLADLILAQSTLDDRRNVIEIHLPSY